MKRTIRLIAAVAALSAGSALAVAKGGTLFIKAKGVKLLKDPKATSAAIGKEIPVGQEVTWNGPAEKDKTFHEIVLKDGKTKGFVLASSLSPNKPADEIATSTGAPMSAQAFASSGAATKGLTEASIKYSEASDETVKKATVQVIYAEEHNKNKQTEVALAAKSKELGAAK